MCFKLIGLLFFCIATNYCFSQELKRTVLLDVEFGAVNENGVVVRKILTTGPSYKNGLRVNDLIHTVNKTRISNSQILFNILRKINAKQKLTLGVTRQGKNIILSISPR